MRGQRRHQKDTKRAHMRIQSCEVSREGGEGEFELSSVSDALVAEECGGCAEEPQRVVLGSLRSHVNLVFCPKDVLVDGLTSAVGLVLGGRGDGLVSYDGPALVAQKEVTPHDRSRGRHEGHHTRERSLLPIGDSVGEGSPLARVVRREVGRERGGARSHEPSDSWRRRGWVSCSRLCCWSP